MPRLTKAESEAAEVRGRRLLETEQRAASAHYDRRQGADPAHLSTAIRTT